eukprot:COSAG02_NODE_13080_length_1448_cov_2.118606_2_plen_141_part_00
MALARAAQTCAIRTVQADTPKRAQYAQFGNKCAILKLKMMRKQKSSHQLTHSLTAQPAALKTRRGPWLQALLPLGEAEPILVLTQRGGTSLADPRPGFHFLARARVTTCTGSLATGTGILARYTSSTGTGSDMASGAQYE